MAESVQGSDDSGSSELSARELLRINVITGRALRRFSQHELARRSGVSRPTISRIERGEADVGIDVLERIARALDFPIAELFDPPDTKAPDEEELMRRGSAPDSDFVEADVLFAVLEEANAPIQRYSKAGRPVARRSSSACAQNGE